MSNWAASGSHASVSMSLIGLGVGRSQMIKTIYRQANQDWKLLNQTQRYLYQEKYKV